MSEPKEPENTCPLIDSILKDLKSADSDISCAISEIEGLRSENSDIREWGQYWKGEAADLAETVDNLEGRIEELEDIL